MFNLLEKIQNIFTQFNSGNNPVSETDFLASQIRQWQFCPQRSMQIKGHLYFKGDHDILHRKRTVIGRNGDVEEVKNLPNNKNIDNQYLKLVNQKANYLLGKPFVIQGENEQYVEALQNIFNKSFMRTLKNAGKAALNGGICWLFPCYDEENNLCFKLFPGYEVLPFWKDAEHTKLDFALRMFPVSVYNGYETKIVNKVEIYSEQGIKKYIYENGDLKPDGENAVVSHVTVVDSDGATYSLNWARVPLIPIKYNENETPLIKRVKTLQDGLNVMISDFENNLQEDARNTILVLKNYDGTNLGEFRRNLATYGAVKVRYDGDTKGGVETLNIAVNAENYQTIINLFKKAIVENGMGYDAKDDKLSGTPNQMNIQSMYNDIDLDANDMETELQAAFEELLWFANAHLSNTGVGNFEDERVNIIFNRDMMMDEASVINNIKNSVGILSTETLISQHPWVDDPAMELDRLEEEKKKEQENYNPFGVQNTPKDGEGVNGNE